MVLRNECLIVNSQIILYMGMFLMPGSLTIPGSSCTIRNLTVQNSNWEEKNASVSLSGVRSILSFIGVGNLCLLNKSLPCFRHLVNTVKTAFIKGFVLGLELCSSCGHILHNHLQLLSLSYSRWHIEGNIALGLNNFLESIFYIMSLSIPTYEMLFSLPF